MFLNYFTYIIWKFIIFYDGSFHFSNNFICFSQSELIKFLRTIKENEVDRYAKY